MMQIHLSYLGLASKEIVILQSTSVEVEVGRNLFTAQQWAYHLGHHYSLLLMQCQAYSHLVLRLSSKLSALKAR